MDTNMKNTNAATNSQRAPRVSIIMPAFNREKFIAESIDSALAQTYTDFELIIIDDGSKDQTVSVAKKYLDDPRVSIIENPKNMGIATTRTRAINIARGEYLAMLDSDDVWLDHDKLKKQVAFLDSHPDHAIIGSGIAYIDTTGKQLNTLVFPTDDLEIRKTILRRNQFAQSTLLCRTEMLMKTGLYSTRFMISDDYDLWLRVGKRWKFANSADISTGYRIHGGNITQTKRLTAAREVLEIVRSYSDNYPHPTLGLIKAYARLVLAYAKS